MFWSLTLVRYGNNPRFPWKPSTIMLTHRLTGTTEIPAANRDGHRPFSPRRNHPDQTMHPATPDHDSSRTTVRQGTRAPRCGREE